MIRNTRTHFTLLILLLGPSAFSQRPLSDSARISVMTIGPYQEELYSAFGHSAFHVYDPASRIDEAYNYGEFNFNQPNFYLNFARGYLYYRLGVVDYAVLKNFYTYQNRYIHEQVLDLTPAQTQKMYDFLQWNALPENRNYRYDYFYDNCATKLRDVVLQVLEDSVLFDGSYIDTEYSIRDLTDIYLKHQPWGDLGIDICLGLPMDKTATPFEYMFLPDYIESGFDHAYFIQGSTRTPLVKEKIIVYEPRDEDLPSSGLPHPLFFFCGLALAALLLGIRDVKKKKLSRWFDGLLFGVTGLIGLLLLFLWAFTDHGAAAGNFNLLWALPAHPVVAVALVKNRVWVRHYFMAVAILEVLLLLTWPLLPQALNLSLIPVVIALAVRAFVQFYVRKNYLEQR